MAGITNPTRHEQQTTITNRNGSSEQHHNSVKATLDTDKCTELRLCYASKVSRLFQDFPRPSNYFSRPFVTGKRLNLEKKRQRLLLTNKE